MSESAAAAILREAAEIVDGSRAQIHGQREISFGAIADLWNAYLSLSQGATIYLRPDDVALMMVLLKIVRAKHGKPVRDHFVDAAGYAALAGELAE